MQGFIVVILGSLCLGLQNVLLRVIFSESSILGQFAWGGFLPATPANSLLVLQLRSLIILPVMILLSLRLYPNTGKTLQELLQPDQRGLLVRVLISSSFLFLALTLLFTAIATIPAGIATVLFFVHPVITGLLAWKVFNTRPSAVQIVVTVGVLIGSVLVAPRLSNGGIDNAALGVGSALGASVAYSIQGILAQTCFSRIHPVPFTLMNFIVMAVLATAGLLFVNVEVPSGQWSLLWMISAIAAGLTLSGQLLYNVGIHLVSAALMSIVAVSNPVFTTTIAWLFLGEALRGRQVLGVGLVMICIVILGQDRMRRVQAAKVNHRSG